MDILSHALWTNLVLKELPLPQRAAAMGFGVLPDVVSFAGILTKHFFMKTMHFNPPPLSSMPPYVFRLYRFTHSLVVWTAVYLVLRSAGLDWLALAATGWGIHILLDIFTHTDDYFPTPILWPFSRFHFSGINWSDKRFMAANYAALALAYILFYVVLRDYDR